MIIQLLFMMKKTYGPYVNGLAWYDRWPKLKDAFGKLLLAVYDETG